MDWINFVNVFICSFIALGHAATLLQHNIPKLPAFRVKNEVHFVTKATNQKNEGSQNLQLDTNYENEQKFNQIMKQAQMMEALRNRREHLKVIPQHLNEIVKQDHIMPLLKTLKGEYTDKGKINIKAHFKTPETTHLEEIPNKFEIKGPEAFFDFKKYVDDINSLAKNMSVTYKVKVEVVKPKRKELKKMNFRRKSKKYNVPLKRKSMQLSQFEIILRKLAEENDVASEKETVVSETTEPEVHVVTRKINPVAKYKPIISRFKKDYVKKINNKRVKPIKTSVYTLHSD